MESIGVDVQVEKVEDNIRGYLNLKLKNARQKLYRTQTR